ncbi:hypothetical protein [Arsenicicoccus dermatophilus]|uniref:hypothetical protein n=1 Tax=Arsenicicoccus dermatophilus TaxID=1076331 RepID=UPI001F4CA98B|nr:hypothetical protein [Arsenicicoccus dermatophilus]MCH8611848.1 hypothetical protein [Arsenicicoccus dermatophilus]
MTFDEDHHQLRTDTAPHTMATLRNTATNPLRAAGAPNTNAAAAAADRRVEHVLTLLEHAQATDITSR